MTTRSKEHVSVKFMTRRAIALAVFAAGAVLPASAIVTNKWQGASGGSWGTPGNWSQSHVPTASEFVVFPDTGSDYEIAVDADYTCGPIYGDYRKSGQTSIVSITLKGTGSVTASSASGSPNSQHIMRDYRKLVLDGTRLTVNGYPMMLYGGGLYLRNGAKFIGEKAVLCWALSVPISVGLECEFSASSGLSLNHKAIIDVSGKLTAGNVAKQNNNNAKALTLSVDGGNATFASLPLDSDDSSLAVSSGELHVGTGGLSLSPSASLELTGGSVEVAQEITSNIARLVRESRGTSVSTTKSLANISSADAAAVNVVRAGETLVLAAGLSAKNGPIALRDGSTLQSEYPVVVRQFFNEPEIVNPATLRLKTIVFGGTQIMSAAGSETAAKRRLEIEGPTTIRAFADIAKLGTFFPMATGAITVDTRDWADPTVQRNMRLTLGTHTSASLVFQGGGTAQFAHAEPSRGAFSSITVSEGTTLELTHFSDKYVDSVRTERFVLGPNSVLRIPAGTNSVHAGSWNIDSTARIEVVVPAGFSAGACALLADEAGAALDSYASQVNIVGDGSSGWIVSHQGGVLAIVKSAGIVDGTYDYEWTAGSAPAYFSNAGNWHCGTTPLEGKTFVFGAGDTVATAYFDNLWKSDGNGGYTAKGYSLGSAFFRNTASKTFTLLAQNGMTFNGKGNKTSPSPSDSTQWGIYSKSDLPQIVRATENAWIRNGQHLTIAGGGKGPVTIDAKLLVGERLTVGGDVRFARSGLEVPRLVMRADASHGSRGTCLTLLSGASMTVSRQDEYYIETTTGDMFQNGSMLNIETGATLTFAAADGASYKWSCENPGRSVVNGTLDILAPYISAANVVYGGSGRINVSEFRCSSTGGSLGLAGNVNLYPPSDWNTVDSYGADSPFVLKAYDSPTIHLSGDWTYGPEVEVSGTTATAAADRKCVIADGAVLTIDGCGHKATFDDPVGGFGTLAVSNGTLRLGGDSDETLAVSVGSGGTLDWAAARTVRALSLAAGANLAFPTVGALRVNGDVHLSDVTVAAADKASFKTTRGWRTVLSSSGSITGEPTGRGSVALRVSEIDGYAALQAQYTGAFIVIIR